MTSGVTLLAALGVLAGVATLACTAARVLVARDGSTAAGALRAAARLCLGLACLSALAAGGELWLSLQGQAREVVAPRPSAWGALWVHVLALLVEWRLFELPGAGRRVLAGWLLAGVGVLFLGVALGAWAGFHPLPGSACPEGAPVIDAAAPAVRGLAALGLALAPLAGIALRLGGPATPPLSAAAASVAAAIWLQPLLPALGWLPTSIGGGAVLALLLVAGMTALGLAASRGPGATGAGLAVYFALGVGGCLVLGIS